MLAHLPHLFSSIAAGGFAHNPVFHALGRIFGPLVELMKWVLRSIHSVIGSWGWSIIILTVIVRLILMPLTFKQFRSAQAMQRIQPKIKELQRKYKADKRKLQEETMKLYQEYRVNPFASCLPLLIQMPIFICLYYAIRFTPEIKHSSFWIIPSLGRPYMPLFIFYIASQFVSTELMMQPETDKQQKWLMRAMPVMFIIILIHFPSGLMLYWVTTNVWTIGQQIIIRRTAPKTDPVPLGPKPPGRFMRLMNAAQVKAVDAQEQTKGGTRGGSSGGTAKSGTGRSGSAKSGAKGTASGQRSGKPGAGKGSAAGKSTSKAGGDRPAQKRPGGTPAGKGGTQSSGKRPSRPSGASDGPKRKPTTP